MGNAIVETSSLNYNMLNMKSKKPLGVAALIKLIRLQFDPITDPLGICAGGAPVNGSMTPNSENALKRRASEDIVDNPMIKKFILSLVFTIRRYFL